MLTRSALWRIPLVAAFALVASPAQADGNPTHEYLRRAYGTCLLVTTDNGKILSQTRVPCTADVRQRLKEQARQKDFQLRLEQQIRQDRACRGTLYLSHGEQKTGCY